MHSNYSYFSCPQSQTRSMIGSNHGDSDEITTKARKRANYK